MEVLLTLLSQIFVLTAPVAAMFFWSWWSRQRSRAWREAAEAMALHDNKQVLKHRELSGELRGFDVRIRATVLHRSGRRSRPAVEFIVSGGGLPEALSLQREGAAQALGKLLTGGDIQVGDPDFDRVALVNGDEATALAVLDGPARERLAGFLGEGGSMAEGALRYTSPGDPERAADMVLLARRLVTLAQQLSGEAHRPTLLSLRVRSDDVGGVRARCLELLLAGEGERALKLDTAAACLDDPYPLVAALAAAHLGDEARLLALLEVEQAPVRIAAARGLERCGTLGAVERLLPVTEGVLTPAVVKRAAREAIDAIQARHGTGERGAFSLSDAPDPSGAVSLTAGQAGAVSLAEERGVIALPEPEPTR